jgi:hypothetical protein
LLDAEVRLCRDSLLQLGENDEVDLVIEFVCRQLTKRPHLDVLDPAIQANSQLAADLLTEASANERVRWVVKTYFIADAYFASLLNDSVRVEHSMSEARLADPTATMLAQADVLGKEKRARKRLHEVWQTLAERSALKVDFTLSDLSALIGFMSAVFVISGYLYTHYFYSMFGMDVSLFFTISDYLAASIEQIRYGAISAGLGLFSFMINLRWTSMQSRLQLSTTSARRQKEVKLVRALGLVALVASVAGAYLGNPDFGLMRLAVAILAGWIASSLAEKFFQRPLPVMAGTIALLTFAGFIAIEAYKNRAEILSKATVGSDSARVHLKEAVFANQEKAILVGANSNYFFLLSNRIVHAVPRDKVEFVEWRF